MKPAHYFNRIAIAGTACLVVLSLYCAPVRADSAFLQICLGTGGTGPSFCNVGNDERSVPSISDSFGSGGIALTGQASGFEMEGMLGASSSATFNLTGAPGQAFSSAIATFEDFITISRHGLDGSNGTLTVEYTLDGNASSSGNAVGLGMVTGIVNGTPFIQQVTTSSSGSFIAATVPIVYGDPFLVLFQLSAQTGTIVVNGTPATICVFCSGAGTATANFLDTLILSGLLPFDSAGNLVTDAQYASASGTQYSINGVEVATPEPSGLLLLGGGLLALIGAAKARLSQPA